MPGARRRRALVPTLLITIGLVVAYAIFTTVWTDKLWFESIDYSEVFTTQLLTRIGLFLVFGLLIGGFAGLNIAIAMRLRPRTRRTGPGAVLDRYRDLLERRIWLTVGIPSVIIGLLAGVSAVGETGTYLAWVNATPFGQTDPHFGLDASFYVFDYPWWRFVSSSALTMVVIAALLAIGVHLATGALTFSRGTDRFARNQNSGALAHLSALFGLVMVCIGIENLLDRYGYLVTDGDLFTGLQYTDATVSITARLVIAIIAFITAALFFANIFLRRWVVPGTSIVLMIVASIILGLLYPAGVQTFGVKPDQPDVERPYISDHIAATQKAYGINNVEIEEYSAKTDVSAGQLKADAAALPGIRLIDPSVVAPTFEQLQQVRGYYSFPSTLDVDRYTINGVETDAVVAAREMDLGGVPDPNWANIHTVYTHGYGLVAAYGNKRQANGEPQWIVSDIPPEGDLAEHQARIYFGERSTTFAIVGREQGQDPIELDTPGGGTNGGERNNVYDGTGGVAIGDWFTRTLYATKFLDMNILLSDRVNSKSKILYDRTPKERVEAVAPWLTTDSNVYPAIVDGRLVWIVDGYTTTNTYPDSERVSLQAATTDSQSSSIGTQVDKKVNYIRNSVKAVVDAYDGSVKLYAWDESDPMLKTWMKVYPGTVQPKSAISEDLLEHLRYPTDLFKVQRTMLGRYHVSNPDTWYKQNDLWTVPSNPVAGSATASEPAYYLSIKWPGDSKAVFSQTSVFVPNGRENLAAYLAVDADASSTSYGKLRVLKMSDTKQIDGPSQTANAINTDTTVAEKLRPYLNQGASGAIYGNLLTLPLGGGLLYVQPIYAQRSGASGSYPALQFVVVRFGGHIGIGSTLQEALDQVFKGDSGAGTGETTTGGTKTGTTGSIDQAAADAALAKARTAFSEADAALKAGDLAKYQTKLKEAQADVEAAWKAMGHT
jgi:uncharacterized membrane protein (UPF0182 family)